MNKNKSWFQQAEALGENQVSAEVENDKKIHYLARDSALRLFLIITGTLFLTELFVMLVLFKEHLNTHIVEAVLDPSLMVLISFPILYFSFLLPLRRTLAKKIQTEKELAELNVELEARVKDRTLALGLANEALHEEIRERKKLLDELEDRVVARTRDLSDEIQERLRVEHKLEASNRALIASSASERAQRLVAESLVDAALTLSKSLSTDEVLDRILDHVQNIVDCTATALILQTDGHAELARWRGFDQMGSTDEILFAQFSRENYADRFAKVTQSGPVIRKDVTNDPDWTPMPGLEWVHSFAIVPMSSESKPIGYLLVVSDDASKVEQHAVNVLPAFAANAALAIRNARLIENLTESLGLERKIREELIQAEKLAGMGRTIASVAHELNNPIQTIKNCVYLIKGSLSENDFDKDQMELFDILSSETQRISNLVSQLREVFRPNTSIPHGPVDLGNLITTLCTSFEGQLNEAKIICKLERISRPMIVSGVGDQLKQVFINLFQNAIEATHHGGRLEVKFLSQAGPALLGVAISDTGKGISEADMAKIFEPFYSTKPKGMGLGLNIVYQIVQQHGGQITIESQVGTGTTFTVWLPELLP